MKKCFVLVLLAALLAGVCVLCAGKGEGERGEYLRVHIRANSDSEADQAVKYAVRDRVVEFLTPTVAACNSKERAMEEIEKRLGEIEAVCCEVLAANGFSYGVKASLRRENFPTRVYENLTLSAGVYDALILELGTGAGDNWWCVVYPPLCFSGGNANIVYKSKIAEIIQKFYEKKSA